MQRSRWVRAITVGAAAFALGAAAACGQDAAQQPAAAGAPESSEYPAPAAAKVEGVVAAKLGVATAPQLGSILVDGDGMALYRFDKDTGKPSKSNCDGDCAAAWPPAMAPAKGEVEVNGVDKAMVSTVVRTDGSKQLAIGGWPAYRFAKDTQAGEVKGQGVGGTWFAFTPAGKKAANQAAAPAVKLAVMKVAPLGAIVVDADGMTLYRFDKDTAKPSKSNCDGDCAQKWPPMIVSDGVEVEVDGVDKSVVGTVVRTDGAKQVTVNGWPLYRYFKDTKPCDIEGQGVGGTWFASTAAGKKAVAQ